MARVLLLLLSWLCAFAACAQTRAWLDREQIHYGETATLNIEATGATQQIDYAPLAAQFDLAGQQVRRSFDMSNGRSVAKSLFAVGIRPRGPGVVTVPSLHIGGQATAPLRLVVLPPEVASASADSEVFVEAELDADRAYVQQAVGLTVRLFIGANLLSGQLDQDEVPNAVKQLVGDDLRYQREVGGRRYTVFERRFLLTPERSGRLSIPGARFNGTTLGGMFDDLFGGPRRALSAAAPLLHLEVLPIPADAPQPWLPLRDLRLRYLASPSRGRVGEASTVEIELVADGATATQLPALAFPDATDAQVFADPPQSDERFVDGGMRTSLRRRISIVPLKEGRLSLPGPRIEWWDATQGVARIAQLPPLVLQVAPGAVPATPPDGAGREAPTTQPASAAETQDAIAAAQWLQRLRAWWPWLAAALAAGIALVGMLAWRASRRQAMPASAQSVEPKLADVLKHDDLAAIAHALCVDAGIPGDNLDAVREELDDAAQRDALGALQTARWAGGDAASALAALRRAFARGARWRKPEKPRATLLPPLYPER